MFIPNPIQVSSQRPSQDFHFVVFFSVHVVFFFVHAVVLRGVVVGLGVVQLGAGAGGVVFRLGVQLGLGAGLQSHLPLTYLQFSGQTHCQPPSTSCR